MSGAAGGKEDTDRGWWFVCVCGGGVVEGGCRGGVHLLGGGQGVRVPGEVGQQVAERTQTEVGGVGGMVGGGEVGAGGRGRHARRGGGAAVSRWWGGWGGGVLQLLVGGGGQGGGGSAAAGGKEDTDRGAGGGGVLGGCTEQHAAEQHATT